MRALSRLVVLLSVACAATVSAQEATLFRIFLRDGGVFVSYGEFTRVEDRVVFSMPVGGSGQEPHLQVAWVAAEAVDWGRTEHYANSTRYQHYVQTRGEAEFQTLNDDVARVLNEIAISTDPAKALELAERARRALSDWPLTHQGYRQDDVREIVGLIDEAIVGLRGATGQKSFELSLVSSMPPVALEPMIAMPTPGEQFDQAVRLASMTSQPSERMALLHAARSLLDEHAAAFTDVVARREALDRQIRGELDVERRYRDLVIRLTRQSSKEAARARVTAVQRVMARIDQEDAKLGRRRPDVVASLRAAVSADRDGARLLRLRRDQWLLRQGIYQDYQRTVGTQLLGLVKSQPQLEAIRRLDGPRLDVLRSLQSRLSGGAQRLERITVPEEMKETHALVVGAWHFAETATRQRAAAVASGNVNSAWEASSAAAGALMMLGRAQQNLRDMLEIPRLQ
jgi:hypothetical protein